MSESDKPDRWNSLLETLGVPVTERKPAENPATTSQPPPTASAAPKPISALPPGKAKANGHGMAMCSAFRAGPRSPAGSGACIFKGDFKPRALWAATD